MAANNSSPLGELYSLGSNWFAEQRLNDKWEPILSHWEQPASTTEAAQIERAARMVREAIAANAWLTREGVTVEPQGSYHNNTNVRLEADMDLRVVHPSIRVLVDASVTAANDHAQTAYTYSGRSNAAVAAELRNHVGTALAAKFGAANIAPGKKAFRVSAVPGSRADIDIVPALTLDFVTLCEGQTLLSPSYVGPVRGVAIYGTDGNEIFNFPHHHFRYGKAKRTRTDYTFKKVVRQLKSLRDDLVASGKLADGVAPSFFIECLAYRVEDEHYRQDIARRARLRRVLNRSWDQLSDPAGAAVAREINDHKLLFGAHQPWTPHDGQMFVAVALNALAA